MARQCWCAESARREHHKSGDLGTEEKEPRRSGGDEGCVSVGLAQVELPHALRAHLRRRILLERHDLVESDHRHLRRKRLRSSSPSTMKSILRLAAVVLL